MRNLSSAEAALVAGLLAGNSARTTTVEGERVLPRRTRETVLRRVYAREWIRDRYVPSPTAIGCPFVTIAVAEPYAEHLAHCSVLWRSQPGIVHMWGSRDVLCGVFFSADASSSTLLKSTVGDRALNRNSVVVTTDLRVAPIPVYFDFEVSWSRIAGLRGSMSYPQSLPRTVLGLNLDDRRRTEQERQSLMELVESSLLPSSRFANGRTTKSFKVAKLERKFLAQGWVERRSFLDPLKVAESVAGFPRRVAFVWGNLLPDATAEGLFRSLAGDAGLGPFLYCREDRTVLLGTLAKEYSRAGRVNQADPSPSVLSILQRHLREIVALRVPIEELSSPINHCYNRVFDDGRPSP